MSESIGNSGKGMKLHTKILLGLLVGAVLGISANVFLGAKSPLVQGINLYVAGPAGQIFLRLLFMIVVPLVFASISLGVAGLGDLKRVGRVGAKAIAYFLASTALAATLGLIVVSAVRPGERIPEATRTELMATYSNDASSKVEAAATSDFGIQTLVNIVPRNPIKAAVDLDMLGIIFFGIIFGAALTMIRPEKAKPMLAVLEALNDTVIKIVEMAMRIAPYGVAALIFGVTSRFGFDVLRLLGWYVVVVLGSLLIHVLVNISAIIRFLHELEQRNASDGHRDGRRQSRDPQADRRLRASPGQHYVHERHGAFRGNHRHHARAGIWRSAWLRSDDRSNGDVGDYRRWRRGCSRWLHSAARWRAHNVRCAGGRNCNRAGCRPDPRYVANDCQCLR
jgi:hypothetical protein